MGIAGGPSGGGVPPSADPSPLPSPLVERSSSPSAPAAGAAEYRKDR